MAEPIPWRSQRLDLQTNNEPLNTVLSRVLALNGISAAMSPAISTGKVNGRLQGTPEVVFRELVDTYALTWYYNGSVLYIYSQAEVESRMLQVSPVDVPRVERTLKEMRLLDSRFPLRTSSTEGQVFVSGPPPYVQVVSDVVARVASMPSESPREIDTRVFRLKHARAADTVVTIGNSHTTIPGIARILNETFGAPRGESYVPLVRSVPVTVPGLRGSGQAAIGRTDGSSDTLANGAGASSPMTTSMSSQNEFATPMQELDARRVNAVPAASATQSRETVTTAAPQPRPFTQAVARADPRTNSVIIRDTQDRMPMYTRLISQLDVRVPLLEIEATVIDVSHDKSEQLGIDWRLHGRRADVVSSPNGLAGTGQGTVNEANDLIYQLPARSAGAGLVGTLLFGSERNNFVARLNALTQKGDANLISRPRVLTLDNTEAVLQSTQDFYVRVAGRDQVDLFNVTLGLMLRVTPTLVDDGQGAQIKLNIRIEDGNTNSGSQVDQIPVVNRNAISTQAVVGDGHSLLIGGYTVDEKTKNQSGVPWLSDIPGLRWVFGQKGHSTKRVERMFMITPRLVKPEELVGTVLSAPADSAEPAVLVPSAPGAAR